MSHRTEAAQVRFTAAQTRFEDCIRHAHGDEWENHVSEYKWNMPLSLDRDTYRELHRARIELNAARLTGEKATLRDAIEAKATELEALIRQTAPASENGLPVLNPNVQPIHDCVMHALKDLVARD